MPKTVLGIDLGKRWFHVVGKDAAGHVTLRRKCNRAQLVEFVAQHSRCLIGMETCCGLQHFARKFSADWARGQVASRVVRKAVREVAEERLQ